MKREVRDEEAAMVDNGYLGSWDSHINELVDVGSRLKDAERQYNQADDTSKNAFEKRLRVLISEFDQTNERFDLYRKVCNGMIGQTSQEVDADSRTEGKSERGSDVASGSEQSEEKKKDDDEGVSTDDIGSWDRHINELVDVGNRLKDAKRQYSQADDTSKNAFEKRLRELISEFDQTKERFDLYRKVCNGMIGQTSQEVDADSRPEGKSEQGSDVASGSEQSEEKKKDDDKGVSTDDIDQDLQVGDEKSDE